MHPADSHYTFSDLTDGLSNTCVRGHQGEADTTIQVGIDDHRLAQLSTQGMDASVADMIDLLLAVYVADRLSLVSRDAQRHIGIVLPVRRPELMAQQKLVDALQALLFAYTGDDWSFSFPARHRGPRLPERARALLRPAEGTQSVEVALWSGGLDAFAGLYHRMRGRKPADHYTLVGTGGNSNVHALQARTARLTRTHFPYAADHPPDLIRIPLCMSHTTSLRKNPVPRARGFVFPLLGAACAALQGQDTLFIYENGIGAINLAFRLSEVGLDHSRAVRPTVLYQLERFISALLDTPFRVRNPFLFSTKAQLCAPLLQAGLFEVATKTMSCDRRHHANPPQCGRCSSCILRRHAFAANHHVEPARTYVVTNRAAAGLLPHAGDRLHWNAMLAQVEHLSRVLQAAAPWPHLVQRYPDLDDVADAVAQNEQMPLDEARRCFMQLYQDYVREWEDIQSIVGYGLLPDVVLPAA